ncbi:MAG: TIGR01212 family radical SAM protein [Syntrophaceae bacterium]
MDAPYHTFNAFLHARFGRRVQKLSLDAGLSCPHRDAYGRGGCIYCNAQGSGTGKAAQGFGLKEQIETQMLAASKRYNARAFIAYFQSYSNTYAPLEELKGIYDTVLPYPEIVGMSIGTRPDCVDEEILKLIASYADKRLVWMEYGLQSANNETLKRINRGHDRQCFQTAVALTAHYPLRICAHVIIGLPGEGPQDYLATARFIAALPITDIKIHLMYVIRGTPLEGLYSAGSYTPLELDDYAMAVAEFLAHLPADMVVQRITGDPHPQELVAPAWALEKLRVISAIHGYMHTHGLRQGSLLAPS